MGRPSSTSRLPPGSDSSSSGIIQAAGLSRSAHCSAASSFARVVLPATCSPTIRNNVAAPRFSAPPAGGISLASSRTQSLDLNENENYYH